MQRYRFASACAPMSQETRSPNSGRTNAAAQGARASQAERETKNDFVEA